MILTGSLSRNCQNGLKYERKSKSQPFLYFAVVDLFFCFAVGSARGGLGAKPKKDYEHNQFPNSFLYFDLVHNLFSGSQ